MGFHSLLRHAIIALLLAVFALAISACGGRRETDQQPEYSAPTYTPNEWAHSWGCGEYDCANDAAVDGEGNVYVAGTTDGNDPNTADDDAFLSKYASDGTVLWRKTWSERSLEEAKAIAINSEGNIYVAGTAFVYREGYSWDSCLLKFSPSGELLWEKAWGGDGFDGSNCLATDGSGNVFVAGLTNSFGAGDSDEFLLKYSTDGNLLFQKTFGGLASEYANAIAVDGCGNVYTVGYTDSFGAGENDVLLLKYSPEGSLIWQRTWGGSHDDIPYDTAVGGNGCLYIAGVNFGFDADKDLAFLLKFAPDGTLHWVRSWAGRTDSRADALAADGSGNVYVIGDLANTTNRGSALLQKYSAEGTLLWQMQWQSARPFLAKAITLDENGQLYLAASGELDSAGNWGSPDFNGISTLDGADNVPYGICGDPIGVETEIRYVETAIIGVEDTGGGWDDALVMKIDPSGW